MTVKELREQLLSMPDDLLVLSRTKEKYYLPVSPLLREVQKMKFHDDYRLAGMTDQEFYLPMVKAVVI